MRKIIFVATLDNRVEVSVNGDPKADFYFNSEHPDCHNEEEARVAATAWADGYMEAVSDIRMMFDSIAVERTVR